MIVVFDQVIFHTSGKTSFHGGRGGGHASKRHTTFYSTKINFFVQSIVMMPF
jgi:hypothetical protein